MATVTSRQNSYEPQESGTAPNASPSNLWWLVAASVLLLVADGRHTIALASWLAPTCLLHFVRGERRARGLAMAYFALIVMRNRVPRNDADPRSVLLHLSDHLRNFCSSALCGTSSSHAANPRSGQHVCLSLHSGRDAVHLFPWSARQLGHDTVHPDRQSPTAPAAVGYGAMGNYLSHRLVRHSGQPDVPAATSPAPARCVRRRLCRSDAGRRSASCLLSPRFAHSPHRFAIPAEAYRQLRTGSASHDPRRKGDRHRQTTFRNGSTAAGEELLAKSEQEAASGAQIIFWSETANYILAQDEPALLARGRALAAKYHVYLGMALGTWTTGAPRPLQNKLVLIDRTGHIAWQYLKARPTPGPETAASVRGDGRLLSLDTPYGRITGGICYDTDFPSLMAQAGASAADIVLSPAGDWRAIDPRHTEMASFRAIEQGFNVVKQSKGGLSAAYDYQGHPLGQMDEYQAKDLVLVAQVPTKGVRTIYSRLGNWFAWLSICGLLVLVLLGTRASKREVGHNSKDEFKEQNSPPEMRRG